MSRSAGKVQPDWLTGERAARKPNVPKAENHPKAPSEPATEELRDASFGASPSHPAVSDPSHGTQTAEQRGLLALVLERFASGGVDAAKQKQAKRRSPATPLAVVAFALLVVGIVWWVVPFFGASEGNVSQGSAETRGANEGISAEGMPIADTGIAFDALEVEEGRARLSTSDGLVWEGSSTAGEEGETITLSGPTAAQIKRGFELPGSSVESGTYAVAEPDGRVLHVTFNTFEAGGSEVSQGSILAIERDRLVYSGFYRDEREPGSEEVVRTYMPPGEDNYRASFTAPEGTPILLLAGFKNTLENPDEDGS